MAVDGTQGAWLVYDYDHGPYAISLHEDAPTAARAAARQGYGKVGFWPFDLELREAVDQWESPPARHARGCPAGVASSAPCTCVIPPAETPCTDCGDPAEFTPCREDFGDRCGPCHVARCAECQDALADQDAAEAVRDGWRT